MVLQHLLKFPVTWKSSFLRIYESAFCVATISCLVMGVWKILFIHVVIVIVSFPVQLFHIYIYSAVLYRTVLYVIIISASIMHWLEVIF